MPLEIGEKIPRSSAILIAKKEIGKMGDRAWGILAIVQNSQYVTWVMDLEGNCFWGHYNTEFRSAVKDFAERFPD